MTPVQSEAMQKFSLYAMPVLGGGFLLIHPALMQLTFSFTALLGLIQANLLRQPWVRAKLGVQPLPTNKPNARVTPYKGTLTTYEAPAPTRPIHTASSGQQSKGTVSSLTGKLKGMISKPVSEIAKSVQQHQASTGTTKKRHGRTPNELKEAQSYEERHRRQQSSGRSVR